MPIHLGDNHLNSSHFTFENDQLSLVNAGGDSGNVKHFKTTITHESPATVTMGTVPANSVLTKIIVRTYTAFDGGSPAIDVGTSSDADKYLYSGDFVMTNQNTYIYHFHEKEASQTDIIATVNTDSSTVGSSDIYIEYAVN